MINEIIKNHVEFPPILEFATRLKQAETKASRSFNMIQAIPPYPTLPAIREHLAKKIQDESVSFYTESLGLEVLRNKIIKEHPLGEALKSDQVLITAGANNAMYLALSSMFNKGEKVALIEPYYFNYDMALKMLNLEPQYLITKNDFQFKAQDIIAQVEKIPDLKGLILITPNNPTGCFYSSDEVSTFCEWAKSRNMQIIVDETYAEFDENHLSNTKLCSYLGKNLHLVGSFSKCFSLTGYRVGYFITSSEVMNTALKVHDTNIICAPQIAQWAAYYGLMYGQEDMQKNIQRLKTYADLLKESLSSLKKFKLCSFGPFFAYLEHPFKDLNSEEATLKFYQETGIMALPGTVFGSQQRSFIRLSYCNLSEADLKSALAAISDLDQRL